MRRPINTFTPEQRKKAVEEYAGRSEAEIAAELGMDPTLIYRWKVAHEELTIRERIEWVDRHHEKLGSKKKSCQVIGVAMATYYSDPKVSRALREEQEADLRGKIE